MAPSTFEVSLTVNGGHQFRNLIRGLRAAGAGDLKRAMNKEVRLAARPVLADLRAAAMRIPDVSAARRRDEGSIRAALARAVRIQSTQSGVRLIVDKRKMPPGSEPMVFAFEMPQGWRHPVFGSGERTRSEWTWIQQQGHPWFRPTVLRHEHTFRKAVLDAMDETARQLEARG